FSSRRRHTRFSRDWSSDVCSSDLGSYQPGWHSWEALDSLGIGNSLVVDNNYSAEIRHMLDRVRRWDTDNAVWMAEAEGVIAVLRSEERRVGKEWRSRWTGRHK